MIEDLSGTEPWRARILASGGAAARVALVQTRASLLRGDDVELSITVGEWSALEIVELGATVAHDVRGGAGARIRVSIQIAAGGRLVLLNSREEAVRGDNYFRAAFRQFGSPYPRIAISRG